MAMTSPPFMLGELTRSEDGTARLWAFEGPEPEAAPTDVSVVIVTWNSAQWIGRCLRALPAACPGLAVDVVVYDNGSTDATVDAVKGAAIENATLLRGDRNSGFAGGVNRSLSSTRGRYVAFLNPDCELSPGSLAALAEHLDANPAGAAVPLLLGEDGQPQREFQLRRFPNIRSLAAELLLLDRLFPANRASADYRYRDLDITRVQQVEQPAAAAFVVRRAVLDEIGWLDETFFPAWFEDVDFCRRMWEHGERIDLVPSARAIHHGGASLDHVPHGEFLAIWYRNLFRYARKWMRREDVEKLRWAIIAGMLLRSAATLLGFAEKEDGRIRSAGNYLAVAREAFGRWDESRSS